MKSTVDINYVGKYERYLSAYIMILIFFLFFPKQI